MVRLGPLFYLPCDDAASPLLDHSGNGYNFGEVAAGATYRVTGLIPTSADTAVRRTSSTFEHAVLPYSGQNYTWMVWVNTLDTTSPAAMLMQANTTFGILNQHYQFRLALGKPQLIIFDAPQNVYTHTAAASIADGRTHFLCFTYDGTTTRYYANGVLTGVPIVQGCTLQAGSFDTFVDGPGGTAGGDPYLGTYDEAAVYLRALSSDEIAGIYSLATSLA